MDIHLKKDLEKQFVTSIQRYYAEDMGTEIGELKAYLLLRFCLEEIAPSIYNQAISDAQAFFQEKVADLENTCFATEFNHWKGKAKQGAKAARP